LGDFPHQFFHTIIHTINGILDTRVLGIESFRSTKEQATEGEQVGLLLEGIERYQVVPGEKIYK
jgi:translation elongation factor EF-Tu-like GTPase